MTALFDALPAPGLVLFNASYRVRGPFVDLDPAEVAKTLQVSAYAGFLVAQAAGVGQVRHGQPSSAISPSVIGARTAGS